MYKMVNELVKLLKVVTIKFKILYFLTLISFVSLFIELLGMMLLSGLSQNKYKLFNEYLKNIDPHLIFISIISLFGVRFTLLLFSEIKKIHIAKKIQTFLTLKMFNSFLNTKIQFIEKESIGVFITATGDESSRASEVVSSFFALLVTLLSIILYTIMIIAIDIHIFYLLIVFLVFVIYIFKILILKSRKNSEQLIQIGSYVNSLLLDVMNGIRVVKSFGMATFVFNKYKNALEYYQGLNFKTEYYSVLNKYISIILIIIVFNIYLLYNYFFNEKIEVLYFLTVFLILLRLLSFFGDLLHQVNKIDINLNASANLIKHISVPYAKTEKIEKVNNIENIKFKNVTYQYQTANKNVFDNLSLEFVKGKSYAIIGESGTGKSTLIDLLMDFLTPVKGSVEINGIDSRKIDEECLSTKIIYVGQEAIIFNDTIKNNICVNGTYSKDTVMEVLEQVELKEEVLNITDNIDFLLTYKGTNISGGQKQRLNIARALIKRPEVLILDESVNALDSKTRRKVVSKLLEIFDENIIIFVTHDQDILKLVDIVVNLDQLKRE